jgi:hypothetical protein
MSFIMNELVRVVHTATPCYHNASARRANNAPSLYCRYCAAVWAALVYTVRLGWLG